MDYIIRESKKSFTGVCDYLIKEHQFNDYILGGGSESITSPKEIIFALVKNFFRILFSRRKFKDAEIIFSVGYLTLIFVFFNKLGLIKYKKIYWWGFFFHNAKVFPYFRRILKVLRDDKLHFIIHSEYEEEVYSKNLSISLSKMHYFPYGSWNTAKSDSDIEKQNIEEEYYFSGGYSNRDYISLINTFRGIDKKLIIICSKNNKEILELEIPDNVTIYKDLHSEQFEEYLQKAKAVIIPFKYNSGASGMSVMLRCMMNKKLVIVTKTDALKEYVENRVSGFIMQDLSKELPEIINEIEGNTAFAKELKDNLFKRYMDVFSPEAIKPELSKLITME